MCPDLSRLQGARKWNETRVILFTEYDDTKRYLVQQLTKLIAGTDRADERDCSLSRADSERRTRSNQGGI